MCRRFAARSLFTLTAGALLGAAVGLSGCASGNNPASTQSISQRQDQALADPADYQPPPPRSVDGGDSLFNRKAVGQDLNDVFNP